MAKKLKGVLIVNLGTPDSPKVADVRAYLREFLMDERVIDIPFLQRWFLVNVIIATFRSPKSAKEYEKVWTEKGSPLLFHSVSLKEKLQESLGNEYIVSMGMRYQNPSIKEALKAFEGKGLDELIVIPLFPQYASASTGSVAQKVMEEIKNELVVPSVRFVEKFFDDELFIETWVSIAKKYMEEEEYDHFLFSYHGLPERQILKASVGGCCQLGDCCNSYHSKNAYCYRAQCFATTRLLTEALNIPKEKHSICFQSRLGKEEWIKPYIGTAMDELKEKKIKKVLAFSPAFVADCLETNIEIGEEYRDQFLENGGEKWQLVESLNDNPLWVDCLVNMVKKV